MRPYMAFMCSLIFLICALTYFNIIPSNPGGIIAATIFGVVSGILIPWYLFSEGDNNYTIEVNRTIGNEIKDDELYNISGN